MQKRFLIVLVSFLLIATASLVLYTPPETVIEDSENTSEAVAGSPDTKPITVSDRKVTAEGDSLQPTEHHEKANNQPIAPAVEPLNSPSEYSTNLELGKFMSFWMEEQARAVFEGDPRDYESKREEARAGDSEAAFWLHLLLKECRQMPRADWQLERRIDQMQGMMTRRYANGEIPDDAFEFVDRLQRGYEFCSVLDPEIDFAAESLNWLNIAADLGHMGAQRLYHAIARELMSSGSLMFHRPELITEFKDRADQYVKRLIEAGHPQGYSLMARMLLIGDVYEQDYLMAYAYGHAAELVGQGQFLDEARSRMDGARYYLSQDEILEAERLAREIVRD